MRWLVSKLVQKARNYQVSLFFISPRKWTVMHMMSTMYSSRFLHFVKENAHKLIQSASTLHSKQIQKKSNLGCKFLE
jgi:hypothetical protein